MTDAVGVLRKIVAEVGEWKIPPTPDNVKKLFTVNVKKLEDKLAKVFAKCRDMDVVKPLFEAYKTMIVTLYRDPNVEALYVKHTLMHMITLASLAKALGKNGDPVDLCSGAFKGVELEATLPYLNWWKIAFNELDEESRESLRQIAEDIVERTSLLDWELGGEEDLFRQLYEVLVEPETRRKIGEYYTPLWLVDRVLREFELRDKLVLDPFCGSGIVMTQAPKRV